MPDSSNDKVWRPTDVTKPAPATPNPTGIYRPDILETIETKIAELDNELRELSLDIRGTLSLVIVRRINYS